MSPAVPDAEAALNNAAWCDAMCRAHGRAGVFGPDAWTSPRRTPPLYPDAVTLSPRADAAGLLAAVDAGPGASVKDSFAALDLRPAGFQVLFEATWIHRPAPVPAPPAGDVSWRAVRDESALRAWEDACFEGEQPGLFPPALPAEPDVVILAGYAGGEVVCGCVLNGTPGGRTAGVSNVFGDPDTAWAGAVAQAAALFPGRPLVGYEADPAPAVRHGFTPGGPLRVWWKG